MSIAELTDGDRGRVRGTIEAAGALVDGPGGERCVYWDRRGGMDESVERGGDSFWVVDGEARVLVRADDLQKVRARADWREEVVAVAVSEIAAVSRELSELKKRLKKHEDPDLRRRRRKLAKVATLLCRLKAHARGKVHGNGTLAGQARWIEKNKHLADDGPGKATMERMVQRLVLVLSPGDEVTLEGSFHIEPMPAGLGGEGTTVSARHVSSRATSCWSAGVRPAPKRRGPRPIRRARPTSARPRRSRPRSAGPIAPCSSSSAWSPASPRWSGCSPAPEPAMLTPMRWCWIILALGVGCGDDGGAMDASPPDMRAPDDAAAADLAPPPDGAPPVDAFVPPSGWAPQPWEDCEGGGRTLEAGADDYRDVLSTLEPGDTLQLRPGRYTRGLPMRVSGTEGACIVVEALYRADPPVFEGSDGFNVIAVHGASWIKVRHLAVEGMGRAGFGVASQGGDAMPTHHVVIEGIRMSGLDGDQQIVGVSTKSPAWDWVIRGNHIERAGTGLYLGNSDGGLPFVRGVVELNTVLDPIGYCMQIKHQDDWPAVDGLPSEASETIVRWNVFSKTSGASTGGLARPNLLLGHQPPSGPGAEDRFVVYGNFFYDNATETLLQAEGNLAIFANVLVNPNGGAIVVQPHNAVPRRVDVFWNTIVAEGRGLRIAGGDAAFDQRARYNAIYGPMPLSADDEAGNVTGDLAAAAAALVNPSGAPGAGLDLHPTADALQATIDPGEIPAVTGSDLDFDERPRTNTHVGAYAGPAGAGAVPLERAARAY